MPTAPSSTAPAAWDHPPTVAPRGTVVLLAGRGEHPGVYERFGTRIAADGYRVRVVADPMQDPVGAAAQVQDLVFDDDLPSPKVLAGSDTGALFAIGLVNRGEVEIDALLLVGLPTRDQSADWADELGERTACPAHRGRLEGEWQISGDALRQPVPGSWFADGDLADVHVPVLGLHGEADRVSPLGAARASYDRGLRVELVTVAGGKHDALNDATHRTAAAAVVLFLERLRLGPDLPAIAHFS